MRSSFFGLEIGRSGLQTHQKALDITGHNLANAATPGYSRQRGEIVTTDPFTYPSLNRAKTAGQVGTGVNITSVIRVRDELIDDRVRHETSLLGRWEARRDMLDQMELVMNEPADSNIRTVVDEFWKALEELSVRPNEEALRSSLRQQSLAMCDQIRQTCREYSTLRNNVNEFIVNQVGEMNTIASQIAELNDQISKITALDDNPNDLMDKRDLLIEELSKMADISVYNDERNSVNITIRGQALVLGTSVTEIVTVPSENDFGMDKLVWKYGDFVSQDEVPFNGGQMKGWLEIRDRDLPELIDNLHEFAGTIITKINEIHKTGFGLDGSTGLDFFKGTDASSIDVTEEVKTDLKKIAAGKTTAPGNGANALEMAELKHKQILGGNTTTVGDFLGGIVAQLGVESVTAKTQSTNFTLLIKNLDNRREAVCGVSYDEEMTNMIRFQHGYNAAARVITTMDEMLDVIINRLKM